MVSVEACQTVRSLINQIVLLDYWKYLPVIVLLEFIFALIILKADKITLNTVGRVIKGQLQCFHKLSLFDRFRHAENGLDINF